MIAPYSITERDSSNFRCGPSADHWFGTDIIGRDVFSRVVYGARVSLRIGIISTLLAMIIGSRPSERSPASREAPPRRSSCGSPTSSSSIPYIILAIAIATVFGRSENSVIIVLGVTGMAGDLSHRAGAASSS